MAWFRRKTPGDLTELRARRDRAMAAFGTDPNAARLELVRIHREVWRACGTRSLETARILVDVAVASLVCGRRGPAFTAARTALGTARRLDRPGGPVLCEARVALGGAYADRGAWAKAASLHEETLRDLTGQESAETAQLRAAAHSGLAVCLQGLGDHHAALPHCRAAARLQGEIHGPGSAEALSSDLALSAELWATGSTEEALAIRQRVYPGLVALLGPDHPQTRLARDLLTFAHRNLGRPGKAVEPGG